VAAAQEPKSIIDLIKQADNLAMSEFELSNNPYHVPNKKDKLKFLGNKLKERMSMKIKNIFDKKNKGLAQ
jgi:hypothetical protein